MMNAATAADVLDQIAHAVALEHAESRPSTRREKKLAARVKAHIDELIAANLASADPPLPTAEVPRRTGFVAWLRRLFGRAERPLPLPRPTGQIVELGKRVTLKARTRTTRTPEWFAAYHAQVTAALYVRASRYAAVRARLLGAVGGRGDDDYARDLVQGALADTYTGELSWDPEVPLEQHVIQAVKSRSRHDRVRQASRKLIELDATTEVDDEPLRDDLEAVLATDGIGDGAAIEHVAKLIAALRAAAGAKNDQDVLVLLDALEQGAYTADEARADTGLSSPDYKNARRRLARYVAALPPELRGEPRRA